jgi:aspartyl-tRNA(Asn)/glutamyl-tRNA(Gln) amidotransferase subunit A
MDSSSALWYQPLGVIAGLIERKEISPVEVVRSLLDRIRTVDRHVKSFVTVLETEALAAAFSAEAEIIRGQYRGPLHGVPIAVKDLYDVAGIVTGAGSKVRRSDVPHSDATAVRKLREAGAIMIGKATTHEFAFGFGSPPTRNPWNLECTPGGSSGGPAAAIAAGLCFGAIGTDTGGSIRCPGAMNGVAGIKPTYGRVSKHGITVLSWSLDHPGPVARTTRDVAFMLRAMAGYDPNDSSTRDVVVPDYAAALTGDLKGLRVGVPSNYFFDDLQPEVDASVKEAIKVLHGLGAEIIEITLERFHDILPTFLSIVMPEAATYHSKLFQAHRSEYGPDVRELLETGSLFMATTYIAAQRNRSAINSSVAAAFAKVDVIATPTLPVTAPGVDQEFYEWGKRREPIFAACARFSCPFNLAGLPAATICCGFSSDKMPIGLQIVGRAFDEATVLKVTDAFERTTEWSCRHPEL